MVKDDILKIQKKEDLRQSLSSLRASLKDMENVKAAKELLGDARAVAELLKEEDPKVRKNAAALLGDLGAGNQAEALYQAYVKEEKRFIRSVYLKALGKMDVSPYLSNLKEQYDFLAQYTPLKEEKKHVSEELSALEQILRTEDKGHTFTGWRERLLVVLTTNTSYREVTEKQLYALKKGSHPLGIKAIVENLSDVVKIRTFRELLFPLSLKEDFTADVSPGDGGKLLASSNLLPLEKCHREPGPFYFRLEIRNGMDLKERSRYALKAARAMEEESARQLINSTDDYEFEVRILAGKDKKMRAFLKMNTIPMERFNYRLHTISSSIHPSTAALLMELAGPYLKKNAQILDPCCGVGTMLLERCKKVPAREIYGIDIFGDAVLGARENAALAKVPVHFIHRDYFDFRHEYLFDEIIANLPMRGKRTKEEQDEFYRKFFDKSQEHLASKGYMILYCNEGAFVKKQLRMHPMFRLEKEFVMGQKGDFALYIIGVKK